MMFSDFLQTTRKRLIFWSVTESRRKDPEEIAELEEQTLGRIFPLHGVFFGPWYRMESMVKMHRGRIRRNRKSEHSLCFCHPQVSLLVLAEVPWDLCPKALCAFIATEIQLATYLMVVQVQSASLGPTTTPWTSALTELK